MPSTASGREQGPPRTPRALQASSSFSSQATDAVRSVGGDGVEKMSGRYLQTATSRAKLGTSLTHTGMLDKAVGAVSSSCFRPPTKNTTAKSSRIGMRLRMSLQPLTRWSRCHILFNFYNMLCIVYVIRRKKCSHLKPCLLAIAVYNYLQHFRRCLHCFLYQVATNIAIKVRERLLIFDENKNALCEIRFSSTLIFALQTVRGTSIARAMGCLRPHEGYTLVTSLSAI